MAEPARVPENASHKSMVTATQASEFWTAVEDCLVEFHDFSRGDAAHKVTDYWRRLATLSSSSVNGGGNPQTEYAFADMIYHEEPWYIACNLAEKDIPIETNKAAYEKILRRNHLA
jgi:hypothetical protein